MYCLYVCRVACPSPPYLPFHNACTLTNPITYSAFEKEAVAALRDAEKAQALTQDAEQRTEAVGERLGEAREVQAAAVAAVREAAQELKYGGG